MRKPLILFGVLVAVVAVVVALSNVGPSAAPSVSPSSAGVADSPAPAPTMLWAAPSDAMARTVAAGLEPEVKEFLINHVHAHLDVFVDGQRIVVPAGIGIDIENPGVRTFQDPIGYGGIEGCAEPCISPLHTHGEDGILHTESEDPEPHTLGQFFDEWGVELSETCVADRCAPETPLAIYVDGQPVSGDPRAIELTDRKVIVVVSGTPPAQIPSTADFSGA